MDRERSDNKLDDWLDQAMAEYAKVEPEPGIEARVLARLHSRVRTRFWWRRGLRPIWISAAAAAFLLVAVMLFKTPDKPPAPGPATASDQELLLGVDRLLQKRVPAALEPALVLTREMVKKP